MEEQEVQSTPEEGVAHSRRSFLRKSSVGVAGFAASSAILAACGSSADSADGGTDTDSGESGSEGGEVTNADSADENEIIEASQDAPEIEWEMATSWPTALTTIFGGCLLYTSPSPRDQRGSRMPSSA